MRVWPNSFRQVTGFEGDKVAPDTDMVLSAVTVYVPAGAVDSPDIDGLLLRLNTFEQMLAALEQVSHALGKIGPTDNTRLGDAWLAVDEALAAARGEGAE